MNKRFKPKFNIKKGDQVVVITGASKDTKTPRAVLQVIPDATNPKVIVEGVAVATKHLKPNAQSPQGSIVKQEMPISISNVMLWDAKTGAPTRVSRERKDGKAVRISKKSSSEI
jgi:large subunit ribosomal protein L24